MSSGVPRRPSGGKAASCSCSSAGVLCRNAAVAVGPGATALTVMSRPRSSLARMRVSASTAALDADVRAQPRRRDPDHARGHVDDRAAVTNPPRSLLADDERTPDVNPVNLVKVSQVKVRQGGGAVDPGGMHDDVEMPEVVLGGVEQGRYRAGVGDVRREGRAAGGPCPLISPIVASARSMLPAYATATSNPSAASLAAMTRPMPPVPPVTRAVRVRPPVMSPHLSAAAHRPSDRARSHRRRVTRAAHRQVR